MAYTIPFTQVPFRPLTIEGNYESERPVIFHVSTAGGADKTRIQAVLHATAGMETLAAVNTPPGKDEPAKPIVWPADLQQAIVSAFRDGAALFVETVDAIEQFTVPSGLAQKVGLIHDVPIDGPTAPHPITTGTQFALVAKYCYILAFEVAMKIAEISQEANIDPRFFASRSTSPALPGATNGTAAPAKRSRGGRATAGSRITMDADQKVM